jgi:hypothetical protein
MGKKYYQTKEFIEISKEWEKKLAENGLPNIEDESRRMLKQNSPNVYRQMDSPRRKAKEEYFQQLGCALYWSSFDNEVDRIVMMLKADGTKISEICHELLARGMSRYRRTVRLIIRKYENRWGIKHWKPDQLKYNWPKKRRTQ